MDTNHDAFNILLALILGATAHGDSNCSPELHAAYQALKVALGNAYPCINYILLESDPTRESVHQVVLEDILNTGADQDDTIRSLAVRMIVAAFTHEPQLGAAFGVSIGDSQAEDGSIIVDGTRSDGLGVSILNSRARHDIQVLNTEITSLTNQRGLGPFAMNVNVIGSSAGEKINVTVKHNEHKHYHFTHQQKAQPLPVLESIDEENSQKSGTKILDIVLSVAFEELSQSRIENVIAMLKGVLEYHLQKSIEDIRLQSIRPGSAIITLVTPSEAVGVLFRLITAGTLADQGIVNIRLRYNLAEARLNGLILPGVDLAACNLSNAQLNKAVLRGCDLRVARLQGAKLRQANLKDADLGGANLTQADLSDADLSKSDLIDATLRSAKLMNANLEAADFARADLGQANLRRAKLQNAYFMSANLTRADLRGADLTNANLDHANLTNAHIGGANLTDTNLSKADLSFIIYDEHTIWPADFDLGRLHGPEGRH